MLQPQIFLISYALRCFVTKLTVRRQKYALIIIKADYWVCFNFTKVGVLKLLTLSRHVIRMVCF